MVDDNELIKEKGKSMDSGAVRQKKGSYESKKKSLASKVGMEIRGKSKGKVGMEIHK